MNFTKKFDRAFQWAGEKMGHEAKTSQSDEFRSLETEMALRHDGYERLQKSMNTYVKSLSRRGETFEDKEKGLPVSYLGRTMIAHGEDFEQDSEFGNCLIAMGRANERVAGIQETYIANATSNWLEGLERSLAMMKEYQSARKKLESRRLTYDSCMIKMQKAKKEDFKLEDELRTAKAKYEESSEDVLRRMQDIKEAEADSVRDLTSFLDCELDYYERCADELRRVRQEWVAGQGQSNGSRPSDLGVPRRQPTRSRSNTAHSFSGRNDRTEQWASRQDISEQDELTAEPVRMPIRSSPYRSNGSATPDVPRPTISRTSTHSGAFEGPASRQSSYREPPPPLEALRKTQVAPPPNVGSLRNNLRPVNRIQTNQNLSPDIYADDYDTATSSGSPEYDRSESPATSYGSLSRSTSNNGLRAAATVPTTKKAPPPPPPSRAKKPPPPVPARREMGY
ncbi:BAR-domain-containing protein [Annulohypoxylon truncatum]|uniref:BAR-domain-containing protein n=1 Tax=Annulohypoxylon truncatum TaxID=327061 RepID=UPI0020080F2A|nr:BAR-domain-containing protein [Annulohypoxylon truncatum]KAI1204596.1 BAR-domain-containing protein [Annulohypoxylon truncatum]